MLRTIESMGNRADALRDSFLENFASNFGIALAAAFAIAMCVVEIDEPVVKPPDPIAHIVKYPDSHNQTMVINTAGDPGDVKCGGKSTILFMTLSLLHDYSHSNARHVEPAPHDTWNVTCGGVPEDFPVVVSP